MKKVLKTIIIVTLCVVCASGCGKAGSTGDYAQEAEAQDTQQEEEKEDNAGVTPSGERDEEPDVVGYEAEEDGVSRVAKDEAETEPPMWDEEITQQDGYISPIDFYELWDQNEEIIAWIKVPGTNISYPVCQHSEDDKYYLKHNSNGKWDINGALFTEAEYNLTDFTDPVTVIYGHNMKSGKMFGYLQETFRDGFDGRDEAIVYLPDREIHYELFAALPVENGHLLAGRNLYKEYAFELFAGEILRNKNIEAVINRKMDVKAGDKLLILSTCVGGDAGQRYIVVGKKTKEIVAR